MERGGAARGAPSGVGPSTPFARRPWRFLAVLVAGVLVTYGLAGTAAHLFDLPDAALVVLADTVLIAVGGAVLVRRGGLAAAGIRRLPWRRALPWALPLLLPAAVTLTVALVQGGAWQPAAVLRFAALAALVGIAEELVFRGLGYAALRSLGVGRAVVGSAAAFALVHLLNVAQGASPWLTLLQVGYAFALGCAYAAALERGGRLLPLMAAHALTDVFGFIGGDGLVQRSGSVPLTALVTVAYIVVFGSYAVWAVRGAEPS
jgi:hypothetical protein